MSGILFHVLLALAAILLLGRLLGLLLVRLGQPPVIGEVVAGIMLGPSLLGRVWPEGMAFLMPAEVVPSLGVVGQLGVIVYMFLVGLDLDLGRIRSRARATLLIAQAGIVLPLLLGLGVAWWIFPTLAPAGVPFTSFALFMGVALSVTAFPVLARILSGRHLTTTDLGMTALSCAAAADATAWCLLAIVVGVAQSRVGEAVLVSGLAVAFTAVMLVLVRPLANRLARRHTPDGLTGPAAAVVLLGVLLSALAAEAIGIHAVFGAFLLGSVLAHDSALARDCARKFEDLVTVLLLPAFFASTGLRTEIGQVAGWENWIVCGVIILAATVGKFGGTMAAARLAGLDWHQAACLGALMNTRGLMELIVLNIGLDLGVISPALFAMMVLMALATTLATTPVLLLLSIDSRASSDEVPAEDELVSSP